MTSTFLHHSTFLGPYYHDGQIPGVETSSAALGSVSGGTPMPSGHTRPRGRAPSLTCRRIPFHFRCTCSLVGRFWDEGNDGVIVTQFVVVSPVIISS